MAFVNEIRISGKAFRDADRKGNGPWKFTVVQGGGKKKDSEERWPTEFFNVTAWPSLCAAAESVKKGKFVAVTGRLKQVEYTDKAGVQQRRYEIVAASVELSSREHDPPPNSNTAPPSVNLHGLEITDADIPF